MLDLVFDRAAAGSARVAPVLLGDERFVRPAARVAGGALGRELKAVLPPLEPPPIRGAAGRLGAVGDLEVMAHRQSTVVFPIERPGRPGNGPPRHEFLDEDDPAAPRASVFA